MNHIARYSTPIIDVFAEILASRWPDFLGRPVICDPFAGSGERLHEMCNRDGMWWEYSGIEIEECFIRAPGIRVGDARDPMLYPPFTHPNEVAVAGWIVVTSPVYANGMADSHLARDGSDRKNYRRSKAIMVGDDAAELDPGNMGNYGYRGTKRDGRSKRRAKFWEVADEAISNWHSASLVLLNVSDFRSGGTVEPHVDDWKAMLAKHGWVDQIDVPVGTQRMRKGENRDERAPHEVVIVASRAS